MNWFIRLNEKDHVVVALEDIPKGTILQIDKGKSVELKEDVKKGHKILVHSLEKGADVLKFGYSIGKAKRNLTEGEWVHTHNIESGLRGLLNYTYQPVSPTVIVKETGRTFQGYWRENGEVGIRNEIWIINTVGCINKSCELLAKLANQTFKGRNIDGIHHFPHPYGCSQLGDDLVYTQKLLASLVLHPNAAGVLVVGLGCENNQIDSFRKLLGKYPSERIRFMKSQEVENELETGLQLIDELVQYAEKFQRQPIPVSKLKIGLKCGGSDGFSGITANPLVGVVSDMVVSEGGTAILTEVPEMFGAETILMNRAIDEHVYEQIVSLINDFKQYFIRHGQEIYENPSPGNKEGGISTLEEKSLGCIQKGGRASIVDVRLYGERVVKNGLNMIQAPGNDLISVTALAAAGAHLVLFTTGRGTPFGGPVPTIKIATNSELANRKQNWIDYNAGKLLEGKTIEEMRHDLFEYLLQVASGERYTKNELYGFREISIFKEGVIL
ncbi:Altronate dehydratase [Geobacillus sp. PA-3]|uniref:UxaA family hydrolase n=1 Tax=Geobacillus sp. PA-3 TaxID=1699078 RepID=UPI0006E5D76B|nr:altronate dehydratase family protein [Geobacillus sp. PA-3]KQB91628.1 Altronate dehydratase [Geobacillus sp. PA-3]